MHFIEFTKLDLLSGRKKIESTEKDKRFPHATHAQLKARIIQDLCDMGRTKVNLSFVQSDYLLTILVGPTVLHT